MRKWNTEKGMSLVEATIILMMLSILTAVIAPSMSDYVNDARNTKVKEDVEAIGVGIARTIRDIGLPCLVSGTPSGGCTVDTRVDLLIGEGDEPAVTAADFTITNTVDDDISEDDDYNWRGSATGNAVSNTDFIGDQLITNAPLYPSVNANFAPGMNVTGGVGWRGPYVSGPVGSDPWGYKYQANTLFLSTTNNAMAGTGEGQLSGGWHKDVFVISAGQNGTMETAFAATTPIGSVAAGDDVIYVIQGSTK